MAAQIRDVLGPFSPLLAGVDERFFAGAPLSVFRKPVAAAAPRPAVPFAAPAAAAATAATALPAAQAVAPVRTAPPLWVLPLVTLAALAFLLLGFWLAWNAFARDIAARRIEVPLIDEAATERALQVQRDTNAALEQELERVRRALAVPDVCTAAGPLELAPPPERRPVPPAAVPPAAPTLPGQPPAAPINSLGQLLERATVMVVTINPGGTLGHGSGFFIAPDTVLTNAHVVENGVGGRVFVTSAALARAIPAQIGAMTRGPGGGNIQPGMSDLAVLRLAEPAPGAQPLALTALGERLTDVVAAGYPSAVVQQETEMRGFIDELARGRLQRPPELVLTRGSITSIQQLPTGPTVIPHSAEISAGNSGGPLVDNCGRVVGINTFVTRGTAFAGSVKYAQKVDSILPWLQQNGIAVATRADACQPLAPGLPATPQAAAPAAPAAPAAAAPAAALAASRADDGRHPSPHHAQCGSDRTRHGRAARGALLGPDHRASRRDARARPCAAVRGAQLQRRRQHDRLVCARRRQRDADRGDGRTAAGRRARASGRAGAGGAGGRRAAEAGQA
jgi:S1-C subfamily serine protease